ncbi:hypothetical protein CUC04_09215 [Prevotella intermedia]|uniref:Uncharacterized protein n=1 Tax=Prevotella intermedia TaxID=28131 RepID=A0A2G9ICP2_PREIN|nr:hypothetical protein CUC04_09215 [Prevotella intermedia]
MHGKSGCFALQKSRFRSAKTKLVFFLRIIFTKSRILSSSILEFLESSSFLRFSKRTRDFLDVRGVMNHAPTCIYAIQGLYLRNGEMKKM